MFWPFHSIPGLFQSILFIVGMDSQRRDPVALPYGQLVSHGGVSRTLAGTSQTPPLFLSGSRDCCQFGEIRPEASQPGVIS